MMPQNTLSTLPVRARFTGAAGLGITRTICYEDGGIGIQDPSRGLLYQRWRARLIDDDVLLSAPNTPEFVMFSGTDITEISFTFDQNMRPVLAFVEAGVAKLRWFDPVPNEQVIVNIGSGVITPRMTMDDKRFVGSAGFSTNDIILGYMRDGALYYRQQRDRFTVEYDPTEPMPEPQRTEMRAEIAKRTGLIKIGMNRQLRLQFMLEIA